MKILRRNGLKGQKADSPGQHPGCKDVGGFALKGQKPYLGHYAFAPENIQPYRLELTTSEY